MHAITANEEMRAIFERAQAERNEAIRAFFVALFTRKPREDAPLAAPQAA